MITGCEIEKGNIQPRWILHEWKSWVIDGPFIIILYLCRIVLPSILAYSLHCSDLSSGCISYPVDSAHSFPNNLTQMKRLDMLKTKTKYCRYFLLNVYWYKVMATKRSVHTYKNRNKPCKKINDFVCNLFFCL